MMVELGPKAPQSWDVFGLYEELSELFGHRADVMHGRPVRYIRDQVLAEAKTIYVAGDGRVAENGERHARELKEGGR